MNHELEHTQQNRCKEVHHGPKLEATLELEWNLYSNENERAPQPTMSGQSSPKSRRPKDPGQRRLCAVITFESNSQTAAQEAWLRCWRCVWEGGEAAVGSKECREAPRGCTRPGPHTVWHRPTDSAARNQDKLSPGTHRPRGPQTGQGASGPSCLLTQAWLRLVQNSVSSA